MPPEVFHHQGEKTKQEISPTFEEKKPPLGPYEIFGEFSVDSIMVTSNVWGVKLGHLDFSWPLYCDTNTQHLLVFSQDPCVVYSYIYRKLGEMAILTGIFRAFIYIPPQNTQNKSANRGLTKKELPTDLCLKCPSPSPGLGRRISPLQNASSCSGSVDGSNDCPLVIQPFPLWVFPKIISIPKMDGL